MSINKNEDKQSEITEFYIKYAIEIQDQGVRISKENKKKHLRCRGIGLNKN